MKNILTIPLALLALSVALPARLAHAAAKAERNGDTITLQNDLVKIAINLKAGARISEFSYGPFGENIVYPQESSGGMLMDHVWEQTWPGEFLFKPYEGEIVNAGPAEATVKVWIVGVGPTVKGLRFERLMTLRDGDRALHATISIINNSDEGRVTGYWSQNNFWFGGKKEGISWARPAIRGIDRLGIDAKGEFWYGGGWYYIDDATAGWNGAYSRELKRGVMCLMEYNDLWRIYDNTSAITTEWMYDRVAIPAGKSWTTAVTLIPVAGMTGFTHGSAHAVANFEVANSTDGMSIEHQVARGSVPLKGVTLKTRVWGLKKPWTAQVPDVKLDELKEAAESRVVKAVDLGTMPAGIEVTLTGTGPDGKTVTETYGDYFGGAEGKNNDPFSMKPYLAFERPVKQKVFLKPDTFAYKPNTEPQVLYLRGLWTSTFGIDPAIAAAFQKATVKDGWLEGSPVGLAFTYFPPDYPSLLSHDLIVLGNVPAAPFDLVGQEMLKDYLSVGGNVLILGGDQAFGQAGFVNKELIALLPVELGEAYNWRKLQGDGILKIADSAHPMAVGVSFGKHDRVYYSHLCTPRKGATVVVTAGDRPIVVVGTTPKGGHIACVLATPFGDEAKGDTAFWNSPAWQKLMQNTVAWLVNR